MLPGMGKMLKNVDIPDDVFKQTEAIISSMTPAEREHPEIINAWPARTHRQRFGYDDGRRQPPDEAVRRHAQR